jgi:hypothetical protein
MPSPLSARCIHTTVDLPFVLQKRAVAPARAARRASVSVVARASTAAKQSAKNSATGLTVLARYVRSAGPQLQCS